MQTNTHPHTLTESTFNPYQLGSESRCLIHLLLTVKQSPVHFVPGSVHRPESEVSPEECSWTCDAEAQISNNLDTYLSGNISWLGERFNTFWMSPSELIWKRSSVHKKKKKAALTLKVPGTKRSCIAQVPVFACKPHYSSNSTQSPLMAATLMKGTGKKSTQ